MSSNRNNGKSRLRASSIIGVIIVALAVVAFLNRQFIIDQITVWQFKPADGVLSLVERSGMNSQGQFLYLASQPTLDNATDFNAACSRTELVTSILGCYNGGKIYIYNITDTKLDGIREVTATHEALHAVYVRLDSGEKSKIDGLLEAEYTKLQSDKSFQEKMAFYERTEPGRRDNELHSVIGTEFGGIGTELETYYSKYFSNRQKVVELNSKYSSTIKTLEDRATALESQMASIADSIASRSPRYSADVASLNSDIESFNYRADNSLFSSQAQFDYERSVLSDRVYQIQSDRESINSSVVQYNALLAERNSIVVQSQELYKSMDSTLAPAPSI
ncbi:MAG: hypothetical protein WCI79_01225 [Candidatus Saccharibacteria bacterium]